MAKGVVINLIGGPGSGKSTTMAGVFYALKKHGVNCEMATEFTKDKVWEEEYRIMDDQLYIVGKQFHRVCRLIEKVDVVIMDTSILSSIIYDKTKSKALKDLCWEQFQRFDNLVFFIDRDDVKYQTEGRRENLEQSLAIDKAYKELMEEYHIPYITVNNEQSVDVILNKLRELNYINFDEKK